MYEYCTVCTRMCPERETGSAPARFVLKCTLDDATREEKTCCCQLKWRGLAVAVAAAYISIWSIAHVRRAGRRGAARLAATSQLARQPSGAHRFALQIPFASRADARQRAAARAAALPLHPFRRRAAPDGSAPLYFFLRQRPLYCHSIYSTRRDAHVSSFRELTSESTSLENQSLTLCSIPEVHATRRGAPNMRDT